MDVTELGMVSDVRPLHIAKALFPMVITELGIVIKVKLEQPLKAYLPMDVTEFGIIVFLHPNISLFELASMMALQFSLES